jgi:hypothetical protein
LFLDVTIPTLNPMRSGQNSGRIMRFLHRCTATYAFAAQQISDGSYQ